MFPHCRVMRVMIAFPLVPVLIDFVSLFWLRKARCLKIQTLTQDYLGNVNTLSLSSPFVLEQESSGCYRCILRLWKSQYQHAIHVLRWRCDNWGRRVSSSRYTVHKDLENTKHRCVTATCHYLHNLSSHKYPECAVCHWTSLLILQVQSRGLRGFV